MRSDLGVDPFSEEEMKKKEQRAAKFGLTDPAEAVKQQEEAAAMAVAEAEAKAKLAAEQEEKRRKRAERFGMEYAPLPAPKPGM